MVTQSIHAQESQLANTIAYRNEETRPYQSLTNFDNPYPIDVTQESYCFRIEDSISSHSFDLAQNFENHLDPEIELEYECDPGPPVGHSISLFDSIMNLVSLQEFFYIPELTLNPLPVHNEIEAPISYDHTSLMGKVC